MPTKLALTLFLLVFRIGAAHGADPVRLLLIPPTTSVKAHGKIVLDVYIWNSTQETQHVPSLDLISTVASWKNSGAAEASSKITTHNPPDEVLAPNSVKYVQVNTNLSVDHGDLVEMYVEIGSPPRLRSNSVLLYCEPQHKPP
jgi:hypothetical protein